MNRMTKSILMILSAVSLMFFGCTDGDVVPKDASTPTDSCPTTDAPVVTHPDAMGPYCFHPAQDPGGSYFCTDVESNSILYICGVGAPDPAGARCFPGEVSSNQRCCCGIDPNTGVSVCPGV